MKVDKRLLSNFASLMAIQIGNYVVPLIQTPYLVRVLGPANFGRVSFAMACSQYIAMLGEYGFNMTATRAMAIARIRGDAVVAELFWRVTWAKFFMSCLGLVIMTSLIFLSATLYDYRLLIWTFCAWAFGIGLFPVWYYQGIERMATITAVNVTSKVAILPLTILLVHGPKDDWIYAAIYGFVSLLASTIGFIAACREVRIFHRPSASKIYTELKEGLSMFFAAVSGSVFQTTNPIVVGLFGGDVAVGIFVGADKFIRAAMGALGPVHSAIFPRLSVAAAADGGGAAGALRTFLKWEIALTLVGSIVMCIMSHTIIYWFLGPKFASSVPLLQLMSFMFLLGPLSNTFGALTLVPFGEQKWFSRIFVGSAFIHMASLFALVPIFGPMGAAISVVASEIIIASAMLAVILKKRLLALPQAMPTGTNQ